MFFVRGRANSGRGRSFKLVGQKFFPVLSYNYSNCRNQQKMRHVLKVNNYFTPVSRFNMMIRTLETLIYDCPNSTSNGTPKTDPPEKKRSQKLGVTREVGGSGPPAPQWLRPCLIYPCTPPIPSPSTNTYLQYSLQHSPYSLKKTSFNGSTEVRHELTDSGIISHSHPFDT